MTACRTSIESAALLEPGIPQHIAIIMDGNGRWAEARGLVRTEGHAKGADAVRETVRACRSQGVRFLTLYAFSVANWQRPAAEVSALMHLLAHFAEQEKFELRDRGIRLNVIGNIGELPPGARRSLEAAMSFTDGGQEMVLSLALSYGGRKDIVTAARALAEKVRAGLINPEDIDEAALGNAMSTHDLPAVDLLIRTSGEARISDFMLYESAYAELLFLPVMWPDFGAANVKDAIAHYASRERRFGLTSAQLVPARDETRGSEGRPLAGSASEPRSVARANVFAAEAE